MAEICIGFFLPYCRETLADFSQVLAIESHAYLQLLSDVLVVEYDSHCVSFHRFSFRCFDRTFLTCIAVEWHSGESVIALLVGCELETVTRDYGMYGHMRCFS